MAVIVSWDGPALAPIVPQSALGERLVGKEALDSQHGTGVGEVHILAQRATTQVGDFLLSLHMC
jgi:hypothetical protein